MYLYIGSDNNNTYYYASLAGRHGRKPYYIHSLLAVAMKKRSMDSKKHIKSSRFRTLIKKNLAEQQC